MVLYITFWWPLELSLATRLLLNLVQSIVLPLVVGNYFNEKSKFGSCLYSEETVLVCSRGILWI